MVTPPPAAPDATRPKILCPGNPKNQRGLLLTEHRRCLDQIIAYCNELIYDHQLQPMCHLRYQPTDLLPPMGYLHLNGKTEKEGGSRTNPKEAQQIAQWLKRHETAIIDWIYKKEQNESQNPHIQKKPPCFLLKMSFLPRVGIENSTTARPSRNTAS
jgi:hypothetical protein